MEKVSIDPMCYIFGFLPISDLSSTLLVSKYWNKCTVLIVNKIREKYTGYLKTSSTTSVQKDTKYQKTIVFGDLEFKWVISNSHQNLDTFSYRHIKLKREIEYYLSRGFDPISGSIAHWKDKKTLHRLLAFINQDLFDPILVSRYSCLFKSAVFLNYYLYELTLNT